MGLWRLEADVGVLCIQTGLRRSLLLPLYDAEQYLKAFKPDISTFMMFPLWLLT